MQKEIEKKAFDFSNIQVSLVLVIVAVAAVGSFMFFLTNERAEIYKKLDRTDAKIVQLEEAFARFAASVEKLSQTLEARTQSRFTQQDYIIGCLKHAILNPEFKCIYSPTTIEWATVVRKSD